MWHIFAEADTYAKWLFTLFYFVYTLASWWAGISSILTLSIGIRNEMVRAEGKAQFEISDPDAIKMPPIQPIAKLIGLSGLGLAFWASWWVMLFR